MPKSTISAIAVRTGFLNFNKPVGITSMEALRRVKAITGQRQKVGHAGTMDPLARGVLRASTACCAKNSANFFPARLMILELLA